MSKTSHDITKRIPPAEYKKYRAKMKAELKQIIKLPKDKMLDFLIVERWERIHILSRYMMLTQRFEELTGEKINFSDLMEPCEYSAA